MAEDKNIVQKAWASVKDTAVSAKDAIKDKAISAKEAIIGESESHKNARIDAMDTLNNAVSGVQSKDAQPLTQPVFDNDPYEGVPDKSKGTYAEVADIAIEQYNKEHEKTRA